MTNKVKRMSAVSNAANKVEEKYSNANGEPSVEQKEQVRNDSREEIRKNISEPTTKPLQPTTGNSSSDKTVIPVKTGSGNKWLYAALVIGAVGLGLYLYKKGKAKSVTLPLMK